MDSGEPWNNLFGGAASPSTPGGDFVNTLISTFEVSSVPRAEEPLPEVPYRQAIEELLGQPLLQTKQRLQEQLGWCERLPTNRRDDTREWFARVKQQLALVEAEEATATRSLEACSRYHGGLVAEVFAHPVIVSLHRAFTQHRPLCLSPDMIWLLICQGVAHHVNVHAEDLRSRLVQHPGKVRIEVRRDDFIKGSPENPWGEGIDAFSRQVREHVGPTHDLFVPRFSTTNATERIAA